MPDAAERNTIRKELEIRMNASIKEIYKLLLIIKKIFYGKSKGKD